MTASLGDRSTRPQEIPPPPYDEIRRQERKGTVILTTGAGIIGLLLIAWALFWPGQADEAGQEASAYSTAATVTESSTAASEPVATAAALTTGALTDVSDIAGATVDAVVVVQVTIDQRGPFDASASGSGVIITEDGTIITNAHVVDAATSITVELTDGTTYAATVVAEDASVDVAVLDIDATGLTTIDLGSTEYLAVGDPVIAIGNPLALEGGPSVSTGIVSALDRQLEDTDTTLTGVIQTDAAITQGSSGGALLDSDGRLIGITTAVGVSSVGVEGIAFAVPVETVTTVLTGLSGA